MIKAALFLLGTLALGVVLQVAGSIGVTTVMPDTDGSPRVLAAVSAERDGLEGLGARLPIAAETRYEERRVAAATYLALSPLLNEPWSRTKGAVRRAVWLSAAAGIVLAALRLTTLGIALPTLVACVFAGSLIGTVIVRVRGGWGGPSPSLWRVWLPASGLTILFLAAPVPVDAASGVLLIGAASSIAAMVTVIRRAAL
ncbi:hypothetical protein [Parvularcula dongshanensis]|uniref:Uncharacterized protein n=1 Tax=Parvularcula dongshanensis TaxID=1173995 RepID=A0A840I5V9_9PROT|nr:hypothetical protein [Parvularcula dongshanensis]MBB4660197.1 hypothetical protein [Parvularcula dongshanensis]